MTNKKQKQALYAIFIISLFGIIGSMFFSLVMGYPACDLCWYQRITLFPLVILSFVGIVLNDPNSYKYIVGLPVIGLFIAIYQNLLYWNVIPVALGPCTNGVSCTTKYFEIFGFITIPFIALLAFTLILIALAIFKRNSQ